MNRRARSARIRLAYPTEQMPRRRTIRARNLIPALERNIARTHRASNLLAYLINVHERSINHERRHTRPNQIGHRMSNVKLDRIIEVTSSEHISDDGSS